MGYIHWFPNIEPALHYWDKPHGEIRVRSLGQEDPLEKGMTTHSSIRAWRIHMGQRSLVAYSPGGHKELNTTERLSMHK